MADEPAPSLTPEQAKARLREAAGRITSKAVVARHPWPLLTVALVSGYAAGKGKLKPLLDQPWVVPLLLRVLGRWAVSVPAKKKSH
ncbi:MAG TPA: hypothetical protein ENI99_08815 [Sedimenticola sp.]|nr:hypothetical protein [Sedimenticola sp.]